MGQVKRYVFQFEHTIREVDTFECEAETLEAAEKEYERYIDAGDFDDVYDLGFEEHEPRPYYDPNQMNLIEPVTQPTEGGE